MAAEKRPTPESFLTEAKQGEPREGGRLKIFLGAAPGVGKTYAMLSAARVLKGEGVDVVVGLAETHGRKETDALLQGLELLARKAVDYRGLSLSEFDLDGALARKPALVLVDELAHTNVPGSRHAKRWQDVTELLDRGIDVYSTLNIQHLETLNDVVAQITGVHVRETVPDSVLERADVELVDLPPEELIERLREGKVYVPEQARRATESFFRLGNLAALRELSLRATAEGVGAIVESQRQRQAPEAIWPTQERLLVSVGPSPNSAKLIRAARRMAARLRAEWTAVFVESARQHLSPEQRARAMDNLRLAQRLGGETVTLTTRDVVQGLLDLARQRNVTKIIVGKSTRSRWAERLFGGIVDELIRGSGDIDVYVIRGDTRGAQAPASTAPPARWAPAPEYAMAAAVAAACTALGFLLYRHLELTNIVMVYLVGTLAVASRGYRGPATLCSVMGVLCFDFFFVPPRLSFAVSDTQYLFTLFVMVAVALVISDLTIRLRSQAVSARLGEVRTSTMHALSRELASVRGVASVLDVAVRHVAEVFDSEIVALMPGDGGSLKVAAASGVQRELDDKERSVAQWVFDLGQSAGLGTQTLPVVEALYAPLVGAEGSVGVFRVQPRARERLLVPDQMLLLESFLHQVGLALEVDRLQEDARSAQAEAEKERLRSSLLSSVSHDLRTPLAAIIGSCGSLLRSGASLSSDKARELLENIQSEGEWLARLVHNIIQTTRLETGAVQLRKEPGSIEEILGSTLERLEHALEGRKVKAKLPADLPLAPMDGVLMEQVLLNLIENAARHTPPGTEVEISAAASKGELVVSIADRGPGLAPDELEKVFEKFYHAKSSKGAGLGLAICRAIIQVHGGRIWAENRKGGGAVFKLALPMEEPRAA